MSKQTERAMTVIGVEVTLTEEMLGMMPASSEVYSEFIASRAPDAMTREQEIEEYGVDAVEEKGITVFPRMEDPETGESVPYLYDYQIRGFFKDSIGMLKRAKLPELSCTGLTAYKKIVDGNLMVRPRKIPVILPDGGEMGFCQRPLRAQTAQGERTALASSETVPAGSCLRFRVGVLGGDKKVVNAVRECLDYGVIHGLGQWRNSGKGLFTYTSPQIEEHENPFDF